MDVWKKNERMKPEYSHEDCQSMALSKIVNTWVFTSYNVLLVFILYIAGHYDAVRQEDWKTL